MQHPTMLRPFARGLSILSELLSYLELLRKISNDSIKGKTKYDDFWQHRSLTWESWPSFFKMKSVPIPSTHRKPKTYTYNWGISSQLVE